MGVMIALIDLAALRMLQGVNFGLLLVYEILTICIALYIYDNYERVHDRLQELNDKKGAIHDGLLIAEPGNKNILDRLNSYLRDWWMRFLSKLAPAIKEKHYIKSFTLMVLTRLIITSGIPVVFFYIASYNYEQNVIIRYKQSEFGNSLVERLPADSAAAVKFIKERPGVYNDGSWIKNIDTISNIPYPGNYSDEEKATLSILNGFRPDVTNEAITEERFYMLATSDSLFFYNPLLKDACTRDTGTVMYRKTNFPGLQLKLTSTGLNYNPPILIHYKGFWFWVFLFFGLVFFFVVLKSIIKKLFALKIPDLKEWKQLDENILIDNRLNDLLFVIGPPGARKKKLIVENIQKGKIKAKDGTTLVYSKNRQWMNNVILSDLINIPDTDKNEKENNNWEEHKKEALDDKNKLIIVNHFEYNMEDGFTNRIKLNFLEALMLKNTSKIMVLSTVHPMSFLDSILFEDNKKREKDEKAWESSILKEDLQRWNVLLGHYRIVLLPLDDITDIQETVINLPENTATLSAFNKYEEGSTYKWSVLSGPDGFSFEASDNGTMIMSGLVEGVYECELKITDKAGIESTEYKILTVHNADEKDNSLHEIICNEIKKAQFLNSMKGTAIKVAHSVAEKKAEQERYINSDELAFRLQVTSHYFYMYIWQSLTKEEKFLLYDLAEDNLVNPFDDHNLSMLIGKGIICRDEDGTLKLFNKGFRNFILTAIGNSEAMKIKDRIKDNGNWNKWKTPLILIFITILAFLMVSQEEAYSKLLTYIGALGAGIPIFLRLLSFFDKSPQKSV